MSVKQKIGIFAHVPMGDKCRGCDYFYIESIFNLTCCTLFRVGIYSENKCDECLEACNKVGESDKKVVDKSCMNCLQFETCHGTCVKWIR